MLALLIRFIQMIDTMTKTSALFRHQITAFCAALKARRNAAGCETFEQVFWAPPVQELARNEMGFDLGGILNLCSRLESPGVRLAKRLDSKGKLNAQAMTLGGLGKIAFSHGLTGCVTGTGQLSLEDSLFLASTFCHCGRA